MANVKNRDNTSKTGTNGKGSGKVGRPKKSDFDVNNTKNTPIQVMKSPKTDKSSEKLQSNKKDRGLLSNLIDKILLNNAKLRKYVQLPNSNIKKMYNGPIVSKNKHNLKLYDNILKSELMIDDNNRLQSKSYSDAQTKIIIGTPSEIKIGLDNERNLKTYVDGKIGTNTVKTIGTNTETMIQENTVKKNGNYTQSKIKIITDKKIRPTKQTIKKDTVSKLPLRKVHKSTDKNMEREIVSNTDQEIATKQVIEKQPDIDYDIGSEANTIVQKQLEINCKRKSENKKEVNIKNMSKNNSNSLNNNDQALTNQNNEGIFSEGLNGSEGASFIYAKRTHDDENSEEHSGVRKRKRPKRTKKPIDKSVIFQCDLCQRQFHTKCSMRRHMYIHLGIKNDFKCKHCNKGFRSLLYLAAHIRSQHPNWEEHYMCNICDKPFKLKENLLLHLASHTRFDTKYKCVYCKEKFTVQQALIKHEKLHLVSGRYQCIICEMYFDCRNKLTTHYKTHYRVKDYVCQHCGKEFIRNNSMRRHIAIFHSGLRIQCPICNKILKGHLTEHMRTHEKKRPHECPDCGQRFIQSTQLNVHRRSHTGARPYPCRICDRPFSHSNALMLHIRRHTGEKPFMCAMCPISFSQLPHMKAHMKNIHGKMNPYKCQKCKQFFKLKVELENHAKSCTVGDKNLSSKEKDQASAQIKAVEVESAMSVSRMRFLLALLLTKIATKEKLKYLGFNKRLIDDILVESLEGMDHRPCKDESMPPVKRLKRNIQILLDGTVPKDQMDKFKKEKKSPEELLELLTNEKK